MTPRKTWSYGEGSTFGAPGYGGFTDVARVLTAMLPERVVSRQLVYMWWKRQGTTGFPSRREVKLPSGKASWAFNLSEVETWYRGRLNQEIHRQAS
jgi:hypothetical protein